MHEPLEILLATAVVKDGKVHLDAATSARVTKTLREGYEATGDASSYIELLAVWNRFQKRGFEPAATQLFAIVQTLPADAADRATAEGLIAAGAKQTSNGLNSKGARGERGPGDDVEY